VPGLKILKLFRYHAETKAKNHLIERAEKASTKFSTNVEKLEIQSKTDLCFGLEHLILAQVFFCALRKIDCPERILGTVNKGEQDVYSR